MKSSARLTFMVSIGLLMIASLACTTVTRYFEQSPPPVPSQIPPQLATAIPSLPDTPAPTLPDASPTAEYQSCPAVTNRILDAATLPPKDNITQNTNQEEQFLVTYPVNGGQIGQPVFEDISNADMKAYQQDLDTQRQIWNLFTTLFPAKWRGDLASYTVATDGSGGLMAAMAQTYDNPQKWEFEVDIIDAGDRLNLIYTLIHEFAHLFTLGPKQVPPSIAVFNNPDDQQIYLQEAGACPDYFPGEGCSRPDSYINVFYNQFWADIYSEWQDINLIEDDEAYYNALDDFYSQYQDRFITDYAATNPEEDIAEVFSFFVLSPKPNADSIAQEKILFFYNYPEMVNLREQIISSICALNP